MQALNRRQEDSFVARAARAARAFIAAGSKMSQDNVICWGDDSNAQLQVPGKETFKLLQALQVVKISTSAQDS